MRIQHLVIALAVITAGCNNGNNKTQTDTATSEPTEKTESQDAKGETTKGSANWQRLVMNVYHNNEAAVICEMPLPATWKVAQQHASGEPSITGPNGVRIKDYQGHNFIYTNDPRMQQVYYSSGQQLRAFPGIEQLIQQDIEPVCAKQGLQFVRYYEIPEITKIDKWYNDQLYKAVPSEIEMSAIGIDWKTADGTPYFLLLHLTVTNNATMQTWYYYSTGLEAEAAHFEAAKKQLVFSLANTHYELEPIMVYNQREAEKAGRSWAAHNQRMAQNQANFEATQRAHVNRSNAINDAIMSGWRQRNAASDKQQEQFIDVINERSNVVEPSTGQKYKVASGANQYWMNNNGEYIGSNLSDYNPNLDDNMNNQKWQELKEVK